MLVSSFMIPVAKVVKLTEQDDIGAAIDKMVENGISAVVVVEQESKKPVGIVTKTELVGAYKQGMPLTQAIGTIMKRDLHTVVDTMNRDDAAKTFEHTHHHHALVLNQGGEFVGLISTWDVAVECAKDARAWPWSRTPDGKMHQATDVH